MNRINPSKPGSVFLIAEIGVNHNGSLDRAITLADSAAEIGADAVKFQTFVPEEVISKHADKADYQRKTTNAGESQLEMVRKLRLDEAAHRTLLEHCASRGIHFLSTPFDLPSFAFLRDDLELSLIKIASGEITNAPLLYAIGQSGLDVILSTGMSTLDEVKQALGFLALGYLDGTPGRAVAQEAFESEQGRLTLRNHVSLLHCTTEYPAPIAESNLMAMDTLREVFDLPVGLSDHTPGTVVAIAAAARGAVIIEKHFTLDRSLPGPDHQASLEPDEFAAMVAAVRDVESALGNGEKVPAPSERKNISVARKSLVARTSIRAGDLFTEQNLTVKRPGNGIPAQRYWDVLGTRAQRDYAPDDPITADGDGTSGQ